MNTLLRSHFRKDGKPKRYFATRKQAVAFRDKRNEPKSVYRCDFCDGYHLGGNG